MHIKLLYRKVLYVFLSVMIVISSTQFAFAGFAASPAGWVEKTTTMSGAYSVINAVKGSGASAVQSVISVAPSALAVTQKIVKFGAIGGLAYAIDSLLGDAVDWVLDPANNRVKYTVDAVASEAEAKRLNDITCREGAASRYGSSHEWATTAFYNSADSRCYAAGNPPINLFSITGVQPESGEKTLPLSTVADKIISNANSGHAPSQDAVKSIALEQFNAGTLDSTLNASAVPLDPNAPDLPVPPTNNPTFDPSSIIAAIQSLMSAINNMSSSMRAKMETMLVDLGLMNDKSIAEQKLTQQVINDSVDRVIANDNVKVGDIVAAIEAIEGNTLDGQVINDAVDRVIAEGKTNTSDIVAAIEAIEGNTLDGQVINDAIDRVIANDNTNAQSAADAANTAAEAAKAADAANTAAVTDAIGAQTDAMTTTDPATGEKSLKLPAFCGFAPVVCEYITWVKGEYGSVMEWVKAEPEVTPDDPIVVADDPSGLGNIFQDKAEAGYVSFESSCPADVLIPIDLMGASQVLNISYTPFCHFASMIRYAVILGAWISGLLIVTGGRSRE